MQRIDGDDGGQSPQSASYDALNRPIQVNWTPAPTQTLPGAASSVTFTHAYDATDRRIGQATNDDSFWNVPGGVTTTAYTANALDLAGLI